MNKILNTLVSTSSLTLCYLDETDGYLKEVDDSVYFSVSPLNVSYKRLYLVGDYIYTGNVTLTAGTLTGETDYEVRLRLGEEYTNLDDFNTASNTVQGYYRQLPFTYANAIPLDVMIFSNSVIDSTTSLRFTFEWEEIIDDPSTGGGGSCDTNIYRGENTLMITPMPYGHADCTLTVNGTTYVSNLNSITGFSETSALESIFSAHGDVLYNFMSYYTSSNNSGEIYIENVTPNHLTISLTVKGNPSFSDEIIPLKIYINNLTLCGVR